MTNIMGDMDEVNGSLVVVVEVSVNVVLLIEGVTKVEVTVVVVVLFVVDV